MPLTTRADDMIEFLGVDFTPLDFDGAIAWLRAREATDRFAYVVTPNVDHIVRLDRAREALSPLYAAASLRLCDSRVLALLARLFGLALPVVPGSDLVAALFAEVVIAGDTVAIIGGRREAIDMLRARYPALDLRHVNAPMGLRENAVARATIVAAQYAHPARFTLIAIGSPQQEMLAFEFLRTSNVHGTALCIGASVDFIVGHQRRAPLTVQNLGLEWAWRLASDPRRLWRRYLVDGPRIFIVLLAWCRQKTFLVNRRR